MLSAEFIPVVWGQLVLPLTKLLVFISLGLLFANFIEALNWTRKIAVVASPLTKFAHLSPITGASFTMAFFSGVSANTMLAEAFEQGKISKKELFIANLFNSLPTYFLHLPTTFFIVAPLIKQAAFIYMGLTLGAAMLRTMLISIVSHFILPPPSETADVEPPTSDNSLSAVAKRTWKRYKKRIRKIIRFTVPIYILFFFLTQAGIFNVLENFIATRMSFMSWLSPQAVSIVVLHIAAEFSAGLAAAGALLADGSLTSREVIIALLIGNIVSSPIRAFRHQFPYYAGIFKPALALQLIAVNQTFRLLSIIMVTVIYIIVG